MKLETYLELTKGWRGQLETGFVFDPTTINADRTPEYLSKDVRKPRDQEFEDFVARNNLPVVTKPFDIPGLLEAIRRVLHPA